MPDMGHVIEMVSHLRLAHQAFRNYYASGSDRGHQAHLEMRRQRMPESASQAASVWLDFLHGIAEAEQMDSLAEWLERGP